MQSAEEVINLRMRHDNVFAKDAQRQTFTGMNSMMMGFSSMNSVGGSSRRASVNNNVNLSSNKVSKERRSKSMTDIVSAETTIQREKDTISREQDTISREGLCSMQEGDNKALRPGAIYVDSILQEYIHTNQGKACTSEEPDDATRNSRAYLMQDFQGTSTSRLGGVTSRNALESIKEDPHSPTCSPDGRKQWNSPVPSPDGDCDEHVRSSSLGVEGRNSHPTVQSTHGNGANERAWMAETDTSRTDTDRNPGSDMQEAKKREKIVVDLSREMLDLGVNQYTDDSKSANASPTDTDAHGNIRYAVEEEDSYSRNLAHEVYQKYGVVESEVGMTGYGDIREPGRRGDEASARPGTGFIKNWKMSLKDVRSDDR
jgi:hypothetical protein